LPTKLIEWIASQSQPVGPTFVINWISFPNKAPLSHGCGPQPSWIPSDIVSDIGYYIIQPKHFNFPILKLSFQY
jgi:hypothetical protein